MTTKEQAKVYADKHGFRVPYDGSNNYYDDVDVKASEEGFVAGANWKEQKMMNEFRKFLISIGRGQQFGRFERMLKEQSEKL